MALLDKDQTGAPEPEPTPQGDGDRRAGERAKRTVRPGRLFAWLDQPGDQLLFYIRALLWVPKTLLRYLREVQRLLAEVAFGSGGLGVIGGTVGVMTAMTLFTGTVVGLQGYAALNQIGTEAFTGFISAYFNTREIAPSSRASRSPPPSAPDSPRSWARCASTRRSTRSTAWASAPCPTW